VERRRAVEQDRVLGMTSSSTSQTSGIIESTIFLAALMFWTALRSTRRAIDDGLNSSSAISFGRPHWCRRSDGPATMTERPRVVDALAEQVLAEPALLALEHVRQRLQRTVARARDGPATAAVVEQCVDGLLQHALLVVDDDLRRAEVQQPLQAVVPVDDAAVEVVEVGGREAAAVQLDHRAQLGGITGTASRIIISGRLPEFRNAETTFRRLTARCCFWPLAVRIWSSSSTRSASRSTCSSRSRTASAPIRRGSTRPTVGGAEALLELAEQRLVVDDLLGLHRLEDVPDLAQALHRILDVGLRVRAIGLQELAHVLDVLGALVVLELLDVEVKVLRPQVVLVGEPGLGTRLQVLLAALERLVDLLQAQVLLGRVLVERLVDVARRGSRGRPRGRHRQPT